MKRELDVIRKRIAKAERRLSKQATLPYPDRTIVVRENWVKSRLWQRLEEITKKAS